jgi:hypothetical protein
MSEREAIARIILDEFDKTEDDLVKFVTSSADSIISEHIEPLRRLLVEWRERAEAAERRLDNMTDEAKERPW